MSSLVTFRIGDREYATELATVREVVRLVGLADLPGMEPPLAGVLDLRGSALPVLDLRLQRGAAERGDVLVVERGGSEPVPVGVAVDRVQAVVPAEDLPVAGGSTEDGVLPEYVRQVLRGPAGPVFLVDLELMVAAARERPAAPAQT